MKGTRRRRGPASRSTIFVARAATGMAAAAAVLLIACANLASLLLSRAAGRRGEPPSGPRSARRADGSVRQMVIEATTFSLARGLLGLAIAPAGVRIMARITPRGFRRSRVDPRPAAARLRTRRLDRTGRGFSLVPSLQAARASLRDALQQERAIVGRRQRPLTRDALVVLQVAAALVLLAGAGLMLRTMANLRAIDSASGRITC